MIPINYQETLAQQTRWAARNLAYNLDSIPADKFDWKPAPTAPSALEIVNHLTEGMLHMKSMLAGGEWNDWNSSEFTPATDLETAKSQLVQSSDKFAVALEAIPSDQMERTVETPFGSFSMPHIMRFQPIDVVHHHGQIAYIQLLLGDTEDHYDPDAF